MSEKVVIIPCSQLISEEMRIGFGHIPPVCMPMHNSNLLHMLYETYQSLGYKLVLGCHEGIELIEQYIEFSKLPIDIVDVGQTFNLGHTILKVLSTLNPGGCDSIFINFGDTFLAKERYEDLESASYIFTGRVHDTSRWTILQKDAEGNLAYSDKTLAVENSAHAIIGVFKINEVGYFHQCLHDSLDKSLSTGSESFYDALMLYAQKVEMENISVKDAEWMDAGHLDKWFDANRNLRARSFNHIEIDNRKGILTKTSENKLKLIEEINWYLNLPKDLEFLIPRVFSYSLNEASPSISMEYYGYQTLADLFVHGNLELGQWNNILTDLKWITEQLAGENLSGGDPFIMRTAQKSMYVQKTIDRLGNYTFHDELEKISAGCILNGKALLSLKDCLDQLNPLFDWCISDSTVASVIHGDFCFSNILYNPQSKSFRLIDPRGSFGEFTIHGDPKYDIAKLSHSIRGHYDFIVRDHFYYSRDDQNVRLKLFNTQQHASISDAFNDIFIGNNIDYSNAISFIEGTLFLSMVPLHQDSPQRQVAMLLNGLELITDLIAKMERREEKI